MIDNNEANYNQFRYATVAARAFKNKDVATSQSALEKLALEMGIVNEKAQEKFGQSYSSSEEALQHAIGTYSSGYYEGLEKQTVTDLFSNYETYFKRYIGGKKEDVLAEFGEETFGDIEKKVKGAVEIMESDTDNFSEDDKKKAKKTLEKYGLIRRVLMKVEEEKISELYTPLEQDTIQKSFEERYKSKE